jgi:hypothetical protein
MLVVLWLIVQHQFVSGDPRSKNPVAVVDSLYYIITFAGLISSNETNWKSHAVAKAHYRP